MDRPALRWFHFQTTREWPRPSACECCGKPDDGPRHLDWASMGHRYTARRDDWRYLCRKCHRASDYRPTEFAVAVIEEAGARLAW